MIAENGYVGGKGPGNAKRPLFQAASCYVLYCCVAVAIGGVVFVMAEQRIYSPLEADSASS